MDYHLLRGLADSWFLLAMVLFFVGAIIWAFRPGSRAAHDEAGQLPFQHEDRPAPGSAANPIDRPAARRQPR